MKLSDIPGLAVYDPKAKGRPCPKPEKRSTVKGRKDRTEAQIIKAVRKEVVERDAGCRLAWLSPCAGLLEWCHLETHRRARTRNMPPALRHTTAGTCCLCQFHHAQYDLNEFRIVFETDRGADGPFHIEPIRVPLTGQEPANVVPPGALGSGEPT